MNKTFTCVIILSYVLLLAGCNTDDINNTQPPSSGPTNVIVNEPSGNILPPLLLPNIHEANRYISENLENNDIDYFLILETIHEKFLDSEYGTTMGYNWFRGIVLADLDRDGTYELYLNAGVGSFYEHFFIHGYNPISQKYYIISERLDTDYVLFIYKNNLYALGRTWPEIDWDQTFPDVFGPDDFGPIKIYTPMLINDILELEEIAESVQNEIIGAVSIKDINLPFEYGLVLDNEYRERRDPEQQR